VDTVILLVDDEEDLVDVLREAVHLALPTHRAVVATSAEAALAALEQLPTLSLALACVDHRLGSASGIEVLRAIRVRWPTIPTILFTGHRTLEIDTDASAVGARVLAKPLRLSEWLAHVKELLGA
jgi:DNA-binding NtrC family response regulator